MIKQEGDNYQEVSAVTFIALVICHHDTVWAMMIGNIIISSTYEE